MLKFTYFWVLITIAMACFFVGAYRNIVSKVAFILWVNNPHQDRRAYRDTQVRLPFPAKSTIINEAVLQKRIRNRSSFLWMRHLLIFFGFVAIFVLDQLYTVVVKLYPIDYFIHGAGRAFLKLGLELSGAILLLGLTLGLIHRLVYAKEEKTYVDPWLILLLWTVVSTGFLTETLRFVLEPQDAFIRYSFIAYPLSRTVSRLQWPWEMLANFMWIVHATVVALFFAYIPYSKFVHIFVAPIGRSLTMGQNTSALKTEKISEGLL
jgi:nitrate reductase gamma subunit